MSDMIDESTKLKVKKPCFNPFANCSGRVERQSRSSGVTVNTIYNKF